MNQHGVVRKETDYDAFGNVSSESHFDASGAAITASNVNAVDQLFRFTGSYTDEDTGLQNNLHRWYDPKIARWLSQDPIGFAGGDANLYRYVGNEPTGKVDPSGLVTGSLGGEVDGFLGYGWFPIGIGGSLSAQGHAGFSLRHKPFFTYGWSVDYSVRCGVGYGIGSIEVDGKLTDAPNVETINGQPSWHAGLSTPVADIDYVTSYDKAGANRLQPYHGVAVAVGRGAEIHAHVGAGNSLTCTQTISVPSYTWVAPWDKSASWGINDTLDLWFGAPVFRITTRRSNYFRRSR